MQDQMIQSVEQEEEDDDDFAGLGGGLGGGMGEADEAPYTSFLQKQPLKG